MVAPRVPASDRLMATGAGKHDRSGGDETPNTLRCAIPDYPGEEPLQHIATRWREDRDDRLRDAGLLEVARGGEPPEIRHLKYHDLRDYPELPPSHSYSERRKEKRIELYRENMILADRKYHATMQARTSVYTALITSTT